MRSLHFTVAKNAAANIVRGGASAVVAIVLPHFLTRSLGPDRFAAWALMLQLAAYTNYLDFGVQTAVARYLAGALERGDSLQRDRLVSNAVAILSLAGVIAVCVLGIVAWQMPHLFRSIPPELAAEMGKGVLVLGVSAAINLPLSVYTGVLIGMQRNEFPAVAIAVTRILGAAAVIVVARSSHSLLWLAVCIGGFNLVGGLAQYFMAKKLLPALRLSLAFLDRAMTMELIRYCSTLSVWSFAMLLVTGLDVTIVGLFDFKAVGAYSIAATLIMFFTGLNGAAFSAMLAPVAVLQERKEYSRISRLVLVTTRLNSYVSIAAVVVAFVFGEQLVRAWVGAAYVSITLPVLKILLIAQAVRLVGSAYGTVLVAMGLQRYGLIPAIVEGVSNLLLSLLGAFLIGPVGVAWATLVAAAMAICVINFVVLPKVPELSLRGSVFLRQGIAVPLLPYLPMGVWLFCPEWVWNHTGLHNLARQAALLVAVGLTAWWGSRELKETFKHLSPI